MSVALFIEYHSHDSYVHFPGNNTIDDPNWEVL